MTILGPDAADAPGVARAARGPWLRDAAARSTVLAIRCAAVALNFASQVVMARLMRLSDFGVVTTVLAILNVASVPATLGYDNAAIRFVALAHESRTALRTLLRRLIPGMLLANGIAALAMGGLAAAEALKGRSTLAESLALLVLVVPAFALVRVGEGWLRGAGSVVSAQINSGLVIPGLATVLLIVLAPLAAHHRVSALAAVALRAASTLVAVAVVGVLVRRTLLMAGETPGRIALPSGRDLRRIGFVLCAGGAVTMLLMQVDVIGVSYLKGSADAGIYGAASRIALALNVAVVSANFILSPRVSRLFDQHKPHELQQEVRSAALWMAISMTIGCAIVFAGAGPILRIFGPDFAPAVTPLRILLIGQLVNGITGPAGAVLNMTGHQMRALRALVFTAVADVIALLIFVPRFGLVGAAWATCGATILVNVVMVLQVRAAVGIWALPTTRLRSTKR